MGRGSRRRPGQWHEPDDEGFYEDEEDERPPRRRPHYPRPRPYPPYARRRHRVWPALLAGCGLGVFCTVLAAAVVVFLAVRTSQGSNMHFGPLGNPRTFSKEESVQVPLASINQMQICDKIGNVSLQIDPNATTTTVLTRKIVHVMNQSDANQEFGRIAVEVQPPATIGNPLTCTKPQAMLTPAAAATTTLTAASSANALTVNVIFPNNSGVLSSTSDAVDITVKLPPKALPSTPSMLLDVEAPVGNIDVNGLSGMLNIEGSTGNVSVEHAILADGSHIETGQGKVSFNGLLLASNNAGTPARYYIQSEQGNIDVTLPPTTNVTIDANTNVGAIHSDFTIPVNNNGGPVNYHGPLNPGAGNASPATLILDVSTGDVNIHKAASS